MLRKSGKSFKTTSEIGFADLKQHVCLPETKVIEESSEYDDGLGHGDDDFEGETRRLSIVSYSSIDGKTAFDFGMPRLTPSHAAR